MAPDVRATGDITSVVGNYYDKVALERLIDRTLIYNLADKKPMPKGTGTTINFNRFTNFPVVKTKIAEGEVPTISYLSGNSVTATIFQVGQHTALSDVLELTSFQPVIRDCIENLMDTASTSFDKWILNNLMSEHATDNPMSQLNGDDVYTSTWFGAKQGGLSTVFVSGSGLFFTAYAGPLWNYLSVSANVDVGPGAGYSCDLDKIARIAGKLRENNCRPFSDGYYKAVLHSKATNQIMRSAEWADWQKYSRPEILDKGEVGRAHGVRIYESNVVHFSHHDVLSQYSNLCAYFQPIWGEGAFAVTEIASEKGVKTYVKGPNKFDTSNPLNQWTSVGWKLTFAAKTLNISCGYFLTTIG